MIFITDYEIEQRINSAILSQITGEDDSALDESEKQAIGLIKDMLSGTYDIKTEVNMIGDDRNESLKMWIISIMAYLLYAEVPDNEVPERVIKDYDDTLNWITDISKGKKPTSLSKKINEDGTSKSLVKYGFSKKRNHQIL